MYNKVVLVGNLTRDLEIRYTQSGTAMGNTGLATNRKWKDQSGEQKEEVMFIDVSFFGRTAEIGNQYLRKGDRVLVEGRLVLDQWTAKDGTKRSKHKVAVQEMKMLTNRSDRQNGAQQQQGGYTHGGGNAQYGANPQQGGAYNPQPAQNAPQAQPDIPEIDITEDELPF